MPLGFSRRDARFSQCGGGAACFLVLSVGAQFFARRTLLLVTKLRANFNKAALK